MDFPLNQLATMLQARRFGANTSDFMVLVAHRHPTLGVLIGTQEQVAADLGIWVESRAHQPHTDKTYEGFYGYESLPAQGVAKNVSIDEARAYEGDAEICRVPHSIPLTLRFNIEYPSEFRGGHQFQSLVKDAVSGATVVPTTSLAGSSQVLPAMADGDAHIVWLRQSGGEREYQWPPDYEEVTGGQPAGYMTWEHPNGETYQYDPIWNIGARPYDTGDAAQAYLLELRAAALADGTARKHPQWVGYLITFDGDGAQTNLDGVYSCLLIVAGDGDFPDFDAVHADATCPALWQLSGSTPVPLMRDPRMRAVGAFYTDPDDLSLWIGGNLAGRNGPMPFLLHLDDNGDAITNDTSEHGAVTAICVCARLGNKSINSIRRQPDLPLADGGIMRGLTECDFVTLDPSQNERLILEHPGGRSLQVLRHLDGTSESIFAVEVDFAGSELATSSFALGISSRTAYPVDGPEKLLHSVWAAWAGHFWCIRHNGEEESPTQSLCKLVGSQLEAVKSWPVAAMDARGVAQCGPRLLVWGMDASDDPVLMRVDAEGGRLLFQTGLTLDRHVWRADPVPLNGSATAAMESVLMVGPITGDNGAINGWHISEPSAPGGTPTGGEPTKVCSFWNEDDSAFNFDSVELVDAGFDLEALPPYLSWNSGVFKWFPSDTEPGEPYLEMLVGDGFIAYHIQGTMPYDVEDVWGRLCFVLGTDGGVTFPNPTDPGIPPEPGCTDAACVLPKLPVGTVARVVRYPADDSELQGDVASMITGDPSDPDTAIAYGRLYPYQWMAVDSDTEYSDPLTTEQLEEFTQRIKVGRETYLKSPARKHIHMVQLLEPGYRPDVLFEPEH